MLFWLSRPSVYVRVCVSGAECLSKPCRQLFDDESLQINGWHQLCFLVKSQSSVCFYRMASLMTLPTTNALLGGQLISIYQWPLAYNGQKHARNWLVRKKFRSFETTIIEVYHGKNILISWAKYKKVGQISFCPANFFPPVCLCQ